MEKSKKSILVSIDLDPVTYEPIQKLLIADGFSGMGYDSIRKVMPSFKGKFVISLGLKHYDMFSHDHLKRHNNTEIIPISFKILKIYLSTGVLLNKDDMKPRINLRKRK